MTKAGLLKHDLHFHGSGTEKVPQRTCATEILPNIRVNFLVRFASRGLVLLGSALELFRNFFGAVRAIFGFGCFLALEKCQSPWPTKVPKKCLRKLRPKRGAEESAEKSASGFEPSCSFHRGAKPEAFFRHFRRHSAWGWNFPKHFFGTSVGLGLRNFCSCRELKTIYHYHPDSKKRKSLEGNSGSIHPYGRYENAGKTSKTISTIAILWPVEAIFEKRAATVEVDTFISPVVGRQDCEHGVQADVNGESWFTKLRFGIPRVGPRQGPESPFPGKERFGVPKPALPVALTRESRA